MSGTPTHVTWAQLAIAAVAVLVSLWIGVTWIGAVAMLGLAAVMACGKVVESRAFKALTGASASAAKATVRAGSPQRLPLARQDREDRRERDTGARINLSHSNEDTAARQTRGS